MRNFFIIFTFILFSLVGHGQQMAVHNMYHFNRTLINPAATGYTDCKVFNFTDRIQWTGIEGAPSIQTFSAQFGKQFHKYKKRGIGINIVRDKNGAEQNLGAEVSYGYHLLFGHKTKHNVAMGLALKAGQYSFNEGDFNQNIYDPIVRGYLNLEWYYNAAAGVYVYNDDYFAGVAVYNLIPRNTTYYTEYGNSSFFTTLTAGYHIRPESNKFLLKTSVYSSIATDVIQIDLNNHFYFENGLWTGITLRKYVGGFPASGQNVLLFLGYEFEGWDIGYTYDLGINTYQPNHYGSHQFSLGFKLCRDKYACPTYKK